MYCDPQMSLNRSSQVVLAIGTNEDAARQAAALPATHPPKSATFIHSGAIATATLQSDEGAFDIVPPAAPSLDIDRDSSPTKWIWLVTPRKPGDHVLHIDLTTNDPGSDGKLQVHPGAGIETQPIHVVIDGIWPRMVYFVKNTSPVITGVLALAPPGAIATIFGLVRSKRRKAAASEALESRSDSRLREKLMGVAFRLRTLRSRRP